MSRSSLSFFHACCLWLVSTFLTLGQNTAAGLPPPLGDGGPKNISLAITDSFTNEKALIYLGDKLLLSENVTTNWSVGVAKALQLNGVKSGEEIRIELPRLGLESRYHIDVTKGPYLKVAFSEGKFQWRQSKVMPERD